MIEARRVAQIAVFLFGLSQLGDLIRSVAAIVFLFNSDTEVDSSTVLVSAGYTAFVLTLLISPGGWAALINVPGSVSALSELARDELLQVGVHLLGLYFLITGVSGAVASAAGWLQLRQTMPGYPFSPEAAAFVQALAGAALLLWGSSVVALVRWLRALGSPRGAA